MFQGGTQEDAVCTRLQIIIAVHKGDIFSPGPVQPGVPGAAQAAVFLVDNGDPGVYLGIAVADAAGTVGGAVVHQKNLPDRLLGQNGIQAPLQKGGHIIYGDDDRNHAWAS